ncbi:MAG: hypothetical protein J7K89_06040 [Candidatus Cloacimonetes bacterium]|nr:hypothetical protein [Candidatus Cloacimonadota bacterium]
MMHAVSDRNKIKEFFELNDQRFGLRKFSKPVLVFEVVEDKVRYSLWEQEVLERFGLNNVDGWDHTENLIYCPDWIQNADELDDDLDNDLDDEDDDLDDKFNWNFGSADEDEEDFENLPDELIDDSDSK